MRRHPSGLRPAGGGGVLLVGADWGGAGGVAGGLPVVEVLPAHAPSRPVAPTSPHPPNCGFQQEFFDAFNATLSGYSLFCFLVCEDSL